MKRQDLDKYHQQTIAELQTAIAKLEIDLSTMTLDIKMNKLKNVHAKKSARQDIARLKTLIRSKELQKELPVKTASSIMPKASVKSSRPMEKANPTSSQKTKTKKEQ